MKTFHTFGESVLKETRIHLTDSFRCPRGSSLVVRPIQQNLRSRYVSHSTRQRVTCLKSEASTSESESLKTTATPIKPRLTVPQVAFPSTRDAAQVNPVVTSITAADSPRDLEPDGFFGDNNPLEFWGAVPKRYRVVLICTLAFIICNMDKISMSVAIIPMAKEYGWDPSLSGMVQSSFFAGYMLGQLPGGLLAARFGGARVLPVGVFLWSLATAVVPLAANSLPLLFFCRFLVGLGEGISPTAVLNLITTWVPKTERSRALAIAFGGLNVGTVLGLTAAPLLIKEIGWQPVFYSFGVIGLVWCLGASQLAVNPEKDAEAIAIAGKPEAVVEIKKIPWRNILSQPSVLALGFTHFVKNWGHYTLLSWLPTYFAQKLDLDLTHAAALALLPPVASIFFSGCASTLADKLISSGVPTTTVRKGATAVSFLGPATFFSLAGFVDLPTPLLVGSVTVGLGLASFCVAGLYSNHQDISPKYSSILLGMTNTLGTIPGLVGVTLTGYILSATDDFELALFAPAIGMYLLGAAVYTKWGSADPLDFDKPIPKLKDI